VVALAAGDSHALALKADGTVLAWGNNQSGELGDGTAPTDHATPVIVQGLGPGSGVAKIAAGGAFSLALKANGTVLAWGNNQRGETGSGDAPTDHATPVQVQGLGPGSGVVAIAAGLADSYALKRDGSVVAWGNNQKGETGSGDAPTDHAAPVAVTGTASVVDIAAGWSHALALKADGTVLAWGDNALGQLGDGTTSPHGTPVSVSGLAAGSDVVAVFAGGDHSHALVALPRSTTPPMPGAAGPASGGGIAGASGGAASASGGSARSASHHQGPLKGRQMYVLFAAQAAGGGNPYGAPPTTPAQKFDEAHAAVTMRTISVSPSPAARATG
jgi:alpha-tubulin suppressor-like RCC1 family protein